jgi:hypothetical protein
VEVTRAFIVRPFGTQDSIDFDRVEKDLIAPELKVAGIEGRTTLEITWQGNIREDMFRLLVPSDLVIADVSIHNANVFYELGIRHGLRDRHTLPMRAKGTQDKYPPVRGLGATRHSVSRNILMGLQAPLARAS